MKTNVLIFPAGEINSVELHDALAHNVNVKIFGASSVDRHGPYIFENYKGDLPYIVSDSFIGEFNKLISEWNIDCVFPTHDSIALYLAEHRDEINARIITASYDTALACRDKEKTYELFADCDFCPKQFAEIESFPCFIKPKEGQGAVGAKVIEKKADIPENIELSEYVICEYLPGGELTVDCVTDAEGKLCAVLPRKRIRTMAGVSVAGETIDASEEIQAIAETINERLEFLGLWYFQLKQDNSGKYKLLEVSARCAGTMCLSRARGVNLPLLSVYSALGNKVSVFENPYKVKMDRVLISRYKIDYDYDTVYVDYDDTVTEGDKVCLPVIQFLYQCRNLGKKLVLVTRHESDHDDSVEESLAKHCIAATLFDEIIKLSFDEDKTSVIKPNRAIFIDNAYAERKKVHDAYNIPVFDVEGMEVLMDWRV